MKGIVLAAWGAVAALSVVFGRGSFGHCILLGMATFAAFGCWAVGGLLWLLAGRGPSRWKEAGRDFLIFGGLVLGMWASLPFGILLNLRDVAEARAFCEALIPAIERIKAQTGRYPATPPEVVPGAARPRLIGEGHFYGADADGYRFNFKDPAKLMGGLHYDSRSGRWHEWD
ncbi:MAG: hypothetical protein BGO49_27030 [Planctomycetales bacterium 71-10]|nr:MAG: hypothetical protein BGO49_27030 [Planctomycetales bacterium 71-10]